MSAVSEGVLIVVALLRQEILRNRRKKRCWIKKWIARRGVLGASNNLCVELQIENEDDFKNMFRVNRTQVNYLLDKIGSSIQRLLPFTTMRNAIPARTKLEIALKYLATGDSFGTLSQLFRVPRCTISTFLVEVLEAIYSVLEDFIKVPNDQLQILVKMLQVQHYVHHNSCNSHFQCPTNTHDCDKSQ
ncbi:unnamed protein product [Parnassius apollo]|uniref:(apollo) hypothetical protein n=1 Tax=Parnassius apollo TaxID=110799 RepID=A0A8S3XS56_PARAO|nr:unnamed protein product [Parnassius apollo]